MMMLKRWLSRPESLLMVAAAAMPVSFWGWTVLLNNFTVEAAAFTGREIGILQSLREVPGFLSLLVVYLLIVVAEQRLAFISLILLGAGVALTGYFPTPLGLYITTLISSLGFHYYETCNQSLALQWLDKKHAPATLGRIYGIGAAAQVATLGAIFIACMAAAGDWSWAALAAGISTSASRDIYTLTYVIAGGITVAMAAGAWMIFPHFAEKVRQRRRIILRRRYWLYYALTFVAGARRQIFLVFAGFLMVEKFNYSVMHITALFLANAVLNIWLAPLIGRIIGRVGERAALVAEYIGLIGVFIAYAFVDDAIAAAGLYLVDHMFFAFAIAIRTYFQKIGDAADMASTASVAFTINHIAAVVVPVAFGFVWLVMPAAVFLTGAGMALVSLLLSLNIPRHPDSGNEVVIGPRGNMQAEAAVN